MLLRKSCAVAVSMVIASALPHCPACFCKPSNHKAGELVAVAHPQHKAGYKNPMAYGAKPKLSAEVTSRYFVKMVRAAADSTCEKKVLMPYRPDAPRNRPKEIVSTRLAEAGA
eukprot:GHRQ01031157.1.p2 GENE.GHRQ01031157.1~~GHRQ01031157.1.p2  ORF type:complete len:113 (+),score=19.29 GHRQ01031157.1:1918-2256(+)